MGSSAVLYTLVLVALTSGLVRAEVNAVEDPSSYAARGTSYSSLLTINVFNLLLIAIAAFVILGYLGFLPLDNGRSFVGRSFGGSSWNASGVLTSLSKVVAVALEKYGEMDRQDQVSSPSSPSGGNI
ncbi:uncharacterized protein LOC143019308 [Oratosquilla oratoria]|uniref:uncharacterized protein LOC143019308 n=1 Tax=Oratosquilla oratoria TaxID=337810 RepID=UPI003F765FD0